MFENESYLKVSNLYYYYLSAIEKPRKKNCKFYTNVSSNIIIQVNKLTESAFYK